MTMHITTSYYNLKTNTKGVSILTLNRPEQHHALNAECIQQLNQLMLQIHASQDIRTLIITAEGSHFCAGADLAEMQHCTQLSQQENIQQTQQLATFLHHLYHLNKPTIAAINGPAFGAGIGLIVCCDFAITHRKASFCFSELKLALTPAVIAPYVTAAIGVRRAQHHFLMAQPFSAQQALDMGLVQQIVSHAPQIMNEAHHLAEHLQGYESDAIAEIKQLVRKAHPIQQPLQQGAETFAKRRITQAAQEAIRSFFSEKSTS